MYLYYFCSYGSNIPHRSNFSNWASSSILFSFDRSYPDNTTPSGRCWQNNTRGPPSARARKFLIVAPSIDFFVIQKYLKHLLCIIVCCITNVHNNIKILIIINKTLLFSTITLLQICGNRCPAAHIGFLSLYDINKY